MTHGQKHTLADTQTLFERCFSHQKWSRLFALKRTITYYIWIYLDPRVSVGVGTWGGSFYVLIFRFVGLIPSSPIRVGLVFVPRSPFQIFMVKKCDLLGKSRLGKSSYILCMYTCFNTDFENESYTFNFQVWLPGCLTSLVLE